MSRPAASALMANWSPNASMTDSVLVPMEPVDPRVTVRVLDENAPGYARASAVRFNFLGDALLSEYTVASSALPDNR